MWLVADAAPVLFLAKVSEGSLFSFAISGAVSVDLQESSFFLFGGELANLHKNSVTLQPS